MSASQRSFGKVAEIEVERKPESKEKYAHTKTALMELLLWVYNQFYVIFPQIYKWICLIFVVLTKHTHIAAWETNRTRIVELASVGSGKLAGKSQ